MMKLPIRKICLIAAMLLIGCFVGFAGSSYLYYKHVFSKALMENVSELGYQIATVSYLRLGEIDAAIDILENQIDNNISTIARYRNTSKTDYCYRALRKAKTYRNIYPSTSKEAAFITDALSEFKEIEEFKCQSSLRRLVKKDQSEK